MEFSMLEVTGREDGGQSTGRIIRIPNSYLFIQPLINSSKEFAFTWSEIKIRISTDSDWSKALALIEKIANSHHELFLENNELIKLSESEYDIRYNNLKPKVYIEGKHECLEVSLRHLTQPRQAREISDTLWREILTGLKKIKSVKLV
jgi:small-conductance mechanosensitive channel